MGLENSGGFFLVEKSNRCEIYCKVSGLFVKMFSIEQNGY
jgi:hypothetical protein